MAGKGDRNRTVESEAYRNNLERIFVIVNYLEHLENNIKAWHRDRNLIDGSTDKDQYMKLIQEAGE